MSNGPKKRISMVSGIRDALYDVLKEDKNCVILGEDIGIMGGAFGATRDLYKFYPNQIIETPICENTIVGMASGMAMCGLRPIVEIMFMDFITLAMDQIINHLVKMNYMYGNQFSLPVVIRTPFGAKGGYGASHSQALESLFLGIPGLQIVAPSDSNTARGLLISAVRSDNPILFLEHKTLYPKMFDIEENLNSIPLDKARLVRKGEDILIVSYSSALWKCLQAAEDLEKESGIKCSVLDLVSLKPLDWNSIKSLIENIGKIVVVEEGHVVGGVGSEIAALISQYAWDFLDGPIERVGLPDCPIPSSKHLEDFVIPGVTEVKEAVLRVVQD